MGGQSGIAGREEPGGKINTKNIYSLAEVAEKRRRVASPPAS